MSDVGDVGDDDDPHDAIVRLEAQIDALEDRIESCRKFILASRIAMTAGGIVLIAMLFGAVRASFEIMTLAVAALIGGIVVWGSNASTAKEAAAELASAEAERATLIGRIKFRLIEG